MPTAIAIVRARQAATKRLSPPARPAHPKAYLASDTGLKLELPFAPKSVELDGVAYDYAVVDRAGREALVVPRAPGLRSLSFDVFVAGRDHQDSVEPFLNQLRDLARRPHRITIGNLGHAAASNAWRLSGFRQRDEERQHGSNATTRATVSLSFVKASDAVVKVGPISGGHVAPPAAPPPPGRVHVLRKGATFWALAVRYYGNGSLWPRIGAANGNPDPRRLPIGMRVNVP